MKNITLYYQEKLFRDSIPWCDFKVYRKERNLHEIFMQALRRLVLLNR